MPERVVGRHPDPRPELATLRARPALGVDLNAGWIAAPAVDVCGNPCGAPVTIMIAQHGGTAVRLGQLRAAVGGLLAVAAGAGALRSVSSTSTSPTLGAAAARPVGRGRRGKGFRRQVADIPTAKFKATLTAMAPNRGLAVIAVDAAHTSRWARQHRWQHTLNCSSGHCCSSHHAAAAVIARRGLGLGARPKADERSIQRCDCPSTPSGVGRAKARTTQPRGRGCGCVTAPPKTRRQPHRDTRPCDA